MEDVVSLLIIGRFIERFAIIVAALVCIVLGGKLFSLSLENTGEADIQHGGFRLIVKRITPGVFFAAFGSTILVMSLTNSPALEITENPSLSKLLKNPTPSLEVSDANKDSNNLENYDLNFIKYTGATNINGEIDLLDAVRSLNTVINLANKIKNVDPNVRVAILEDISLAGTNLLKFRDILLAKNLGEPEVNLWKQHGENFQKNPSDFGYIDRKKLEQISKWFSEGESLNVD